MLVRILVYCRIYSLSYLNRALRKYNFSCILILKETELEKPEGLQPANDHLEGKYELEKSMPEEHPSEAGLKREQVYFKCTLILVTICLKR